MTPADLPPPSLPLVEISTLFLNFLTLPQSNEEAFIQMELTIEWIAVPKWKV